MKYAVIKTGGKQYIVQENDVLDVEKLDKEKGNKLVFKELLLVLDGKKTLLGKPFVKKAQVEADVLEQFRGEKIKVGRFRSKKRHSKIKGHRQYLTKIKINSIKLSKTKKNGKNKTKKGN